PDPTEFNTLLGVIGEHGHWTIAAMYPCEKKTVFPDSLGESELKIRKCLDRTRAFMRSKGCNVSKWRCETLPHSLQRDGVSCGVFVCKFAQRLLHDQPVWFLNETQVIDKQRRKMAFTDFSRNRMTSVNSVHFVEKWRRTTHG
ncbi:sentrin-specific protease 2-like isoform X2, partial [Clarias magur]